ncbi:unnamed protein product [Amoebophrya sp. A120]|nr:unnamed protein product [Amoebophrya sp. A120]|eukprot:GSA120T00019546001.1
MIEMSNFSSGTRTSNSMMQNRVTRRRSMSPKSSSGGQGKMPCHAWKDRPEVTGPKCRDPLIFGSPPPKRGTKRAKDNMAKKSSRANVNMKDYEDPAANHEHAIDQERHLEPEHQRSLDYHPRGGPSVVVATTTARNLTRMKSSGGSSSTSPKKLLDDSPVKISTNPSTNHNKSTWQPHISTAAPGGSTAASSSFSSSSYRPILVGGGGGGAAPYRSVVTRSSLASPRGGGGLFGGINMKSSSTTGKQAATVIRPTLVSSSGSLFQPESRVSLLSSSKSSTVTASSPVEGRGSSSLRQMNSLAVARTTAGKNSSSTSTGAATADEHQVPVSRRTSGPRRPGSSSPAGKVMKSPVGSTRRHDPGAVSFSSSKTSAVSSIATTTRHHDYSPPPRRLSAGAASTSKSSCEKNYEVEQRRGASGCSKSTSTKKSPAATSKSPKTGTAASARGRGALSSSSFSTTGAGSTTAASAHHSLKKDYYARAKRSLENNYSQHVEQLARKKLNEELRQIELLLKTEREQNEKLEGKKKQIQERIFQKEQNEQNKLLKISQEKTELLEQERHIAEKLESVEAKESRRALEDKARQLRLMLSQDVVPVGSDAWKKQQELDLEEEARRLKDENLELVERLREVPVVSEDLPTLEAAKHLPFSTTRTGNKASTSSSTTNGNNKSLIASKIPPKKLTIFDKDLVTEETVMKILPKKNELPEFQLWKEHYATRTEGVDVHQEPKILRKEPLQYTNKTELDTPDVNLVPTTLSANLEKIKHSGQLKDLARECISARQIPLPMKPGMTMGYNPHNPYDKSKPINSPRVPLSTPQFAPARIKPVSMLISSPRTTTTSRSSHVVYRSSTSLSPRQQSRNVVGVRLSPRGPAGGGSVAVKNGGGLDGAQRSSTTSVRIATVSSSSPKTTNDGGGARQGEEDDVLATSSASRNKNSSLKTLKGNGLRGRQVSNSDLTRSGGRSRSRSASPGGVGSRTEKISRAISAGDGDAASPTTSGECKNLKAQQQAKMKRQQQLLMGHIDADSPTMDQHHDAEFSNNPSGEIDLLLSASPAAMSPDSNFHTNSERKRYKNTRKLESFIIKNLDFAADEAAGFARRSGAGKISQRTKRDEQAQSSRSPSPSLAMVHLSSPARSEKRGLAEVDHDSIRERKSTIAQEEKRATDPVSPIGPRTSDDLYHPDLETNANPEKVFRQVLQKNKKMTNLHAAGGPTGCSNAATSASTANHASNGNGTTGRVTRPPSGARTATASRSNRKKTGTSSIDGAAAAQSSTSSSNVVAPARHQPKSSRSSRLIPTSSSLSRDNAASLARQSPRGAAAAGAGNKGVRTAARIASTAGKQARINNAPSKMKTRDDHTRHATTSSSSCFAVHDEDPQQEHDEDPPQQEFSSTSGEVRVRDPQLVGRANDDVACSNSCSFSTSALAAGCNDDCAGTTSSTEPVAVVAEKNRNYTPRRTQPLLIKSGVTRVSRQHEATLDAENNYSASESCYNLDDQEHDELHEILVTEVHAVQASPRLAEEQMRVGNFASSANKFEKLAARRIVSPPRNVVGGTTSNMASPAGGTGSSSPSGTRAHQFQEQPQSKRSGQKHFQHQEEGTTALVIPADTQWTRATGYWSPNSSVAHMLTLGTTSNDQQLHKIEMPKLRITEKCNGVFTPRLNYTNSARLKQADLSSCGGVVKNIPSPVAGAASSASSSAGFAQLQHHPAVVHQHLRDATRQVAPGVSSLLSTPRATIGGIGVRSSIGMMKNNPETTTVVSGAGPGITTTKSGVNTYCSAQAEKQAVVLASPCSPRNLPPPSTSKVTSSSKGSTERRGGRGPGVNNKNHTTKSPSSKVTVDLEDADRHNHEATVVPNYNTTSSHSQSVLILQHSQEERTIDLQSDEANET